MKKLLSLICALALFASMTGCAAGKSTETAPDLPPETTAADASAAQTLYGQVTGLEGTTVTVLLGTYTQGEAPAEGGTPPEKPENGGSEDPERAGAAHNSHGGAASEGQTASEKPQRNGESGGQRPGGQGGPNGFGSFQAGGEGAAFDLPQAEISVARGHEQTAGTLEDIAVDAILELTVEENTVTKAVVRAAGGGMPDGETGGHGGGFTQGGAAQGETEAQTGKAVKHKGA